MEQLIRDLNNTANQAFPERIKQIQAQLQQLQRERSAWDTGLAFLQHDDAIIRFYGALTLTIKINVDWDTDDLKGNQSMQEHLRHALVASYVSLTLVEDATFVLQKLCSTLCTLYQRTAKDWHHPVRHVFTCLLHGRYLAQDEVQTIRDSAGRDTNIAPARLSSALRFASTIAEDILTRPSTDPAIARSLSTSCGDVFALFNLCLREQELTADPQTGNGTSTIGPSTSGDDIALTRLALHTLPGWIPSLRKQVEQVPQDEAASASEEALASIATSLRCLEDEALTDAALQTVIHIQETSPALLLKADGDFPQSVINAGPVQQYRSQLQAGDFDPNAALLAEFLEAVIAQIDTTSPEYIESGRYNNILQMLLDLLQCPGVPAVEDDVCPGALDSIAQILEGHTDWTDPSPAEEFLKEYARQACQSCLTKVVLSDEELSRATETWDRDDRTRFHVFMRDVQDFFQSAFGLLGSSVVEAVVLAIVQPTSSATWGHFDAALNCLMAFGDTMAAEPETYDPYIAAVLSSQKFQLVLNGDNVPDRPRSSSIKLLAGCTTYLQAHPDLMQILNFLFSSLHLPASAGGASRAIYALCDAQRTSLTQALPGFLASFSTIGDLGAVERQRIFGGVAAIVQALPDEQDKISPLDTMLRYTSDHVSKVLSPTGDPGVQSQWTNDVLGTLGAIGRGLRAPEDAPLTTETKPAVESIFWTGGPGFGIQRQVLNIYETIMRQVDLQRDVTTIEAACHFIRSGFPEEHPSPFKFTPSSTIELVVYMIALDSVNINPVLECASALLASGDHETYDQYLPRLLDPIYNALQQLLHKPGSNQAARSSDFPAAALNFVTRILPKWAATLLSSDAGSPIFDIFIDTALAVISYPDTLPRRSAAAFFSALIDIAKPSKYLNETAQHVLQTTLRDRSPGIVACLIRLLGGECARSELEALTDPVKRYVQYQPMLFKNIAKEAMRNTSGVLNAKALSSTTIEQRLRVVAQLDTLRGARKTNDVVKDFWLACRGASFEYIA